MRKKPLWIVILSISLLILIAGGVFLFVYFYARQDDLPKVGDMTTQTAQDESSATQASTQPETQPPTIEAFGYDIEPSPDITELSFDELMAINHDCYAWIYVPNTNIDYPVMQSLTDWDDTYYLNHNIYREYQFSGCIYSEVQNALDFQDPVTVLYGHNMLNGSMFATLHYFSDKDFFDENNTAFIFTKDKVLTYLIYAAYTYDDRHILNSFNMRDPESFAEYRASTLEPRTYNCNIREGVELDEDSRILTLSTCSNGGGNTRYLVQGVLVDEQERIVESPSEQDGTDE